MQARDIKRWRRELDLSQTDAGRMLGVSRITIQNWERGRTPIPAMAEGACERATRRWKQRADYGPVTLVYFGAPLGERRGENHVEYFATTELALSRVLRLWRRPNFHAATILDDQTGLSIWHDHELEREIERRRGRAQTPPDKAELVNALLEIGREYRSLPLLDGRSEDEILGYDEHGLPN